MALTHLQVCRGPKEWPAAPQELSVSSLAEIEECPRRWSLRNASYPEIWSRRGYPTAPTPSALAGTALHLSLERIAAELLSAGCDSAQGAAAVQVMRRLGGYTAVVERAAHELLADLEQNPRFATRAGPMKRALLGRVPQLRERMQRLLSRLRLVTGYLPARTVQKASGTRRALPRGSHSEVDLRAPQLGWRGTADLLTVLESSCEISDFKSGEHDDSHRFQLQVYALLWQRDAELNPSGTLATRLVVAYSDVDVEVAPLTDDELPRFERALVARSAEARERLARRPPPATPGPEACAWCPVRHLCTEYWNPSVIRRVRPVVLEDDRYDDVELVAEEPQGPGLWSATVLASSSLTPGVAVKLQVGAAHADVIAPAKRLRLVGARVTELEDIDAETHALLVAPSPWTEVFVLD